MNVVIAKILKSKIADAIYIDRLTGMVREVTRSYPTGTGGTILKNFPVSLDELNDQNCNQDSFMKQLVPDAQYKSIIYFEDAGVVYSERTGTSMHFISSLRLVAWVNMKKFATQAGTISSILVADIAARLFDMGRVNEEGFQNVHVSKIAEMEKSQSIFRKYSYDDKAAFLLYPYDFFSLLIETKFQVNKTCINLLSLDDSNCDTN